MPARGLDSCGRRLLDDGHASACWGTGGCGRSVWLRRSRGLEARAHSVPLGFAPSLAYTGFEQLYFAPGMFDPKAENYFTYLFFWWVEGVPEVTEPTLARGLVAYYRGLSAAVGEPKKLTMGRSWARRPWRTTI